MSTPEEPLFTAIERDDREMDAAHARTAESRELFRSHVDRRGEHVCSAKLRFRDPDLSEELGADQFLFLWLTSVVFHAQDGLYSGVFFEVPSGFRKWHDLGERLGFESEDVFDWMVNDDGRVHGAFTLRVARDRLPEAERGEFDEAVGASAWEPLPT